MSPLHALSNIKNQHYVWRHYLKPWLDKGKIWCIRGAKPFKINVEKIAKDDYFYAADPLNASEKHLIESLISKLHPTGWDLLQNVYEVYLSASHGPDFFRKNAIEKYHSIIERSAIPVLDKIYSGYLRFWKSENDRVNFSRFIGIQYTRTKKFIDSMIAVFNAFNNHPQYPSDINPLNIAKVWSLIQAEIIGNWLYSSAYPVLIKNESKTSFLTSDQPVYNLKADLKNRFTPPTQLELYYPISPQYALIFNQDSNRPDIKSISNCDVYNKFIIESSREYVFSNSKSLLHNYFNK